MKSSVKIADNMVKYLMRYLDDVTIIESGEEYYAFKLKTDILIEVMEEEEDGLILITVDLYKDENKTQEYTFHSVMSFETWFTRNILAIADGDESLLLLVD